MSPLEQLQADIVGIIANSPFFADITVLREDTGLTESDLQQSIGAMAVKGGKLGACIVVFQSEETTSKPEAVGPEDEVTTLIRVLEVPEINRGPQGSGVTARAMATKLRRLLHLASRGPTALRASRARRYQDGEGTIGFDLPILTIINLDREQRVPQPQITGSDRDAVTMACAYPGARIFYVTDGTYPAPDTATLYAAPIAVDPNTVIRAVAYPPDGSPAPEASGISQLKIP